MAYSDSPITVKGREYECFADSIMKKYNNFNQSFTKFEPPGPGYYTGNEEVNFTNCPVYSERIIEYDHSMPKIPFLPDACHNKQTVRVFWVSDEEFHYMEINITNGAPMVDNFYVTLITIVRQVGPDVQFTFNTKTTMIR